MIKRRPTQLQSFSQGSGMGMKYPDWDNGIELSPNTNHLIKKNGWIHWQLITSSTNSANVILYINGHLISWVTADS